MKRPLKIGMISLALLAGAGSLCYSPDQIDFKKREALEQAIKEGRYDSGFLDSLLEPSALTNKLREPTGTTKDFERKAREYGAIPYDPSEIGDFTTTYIPNIENFIPLKIKEEALSDTLFLYGKARFVLDRHDSIILKAAQTESILEIEVNSYDINFRERNDLTEKYRQYIEKAVIESIKECRVIGESYKGPVYVELPFVLNVNRIISERKK